MDRSAFCRSWQPVGCQPWRSFPRLLLCLRFPELELRPCSAGERFWNRCHAATFRRCFGAVFVFAAAAFWSVTTPLNRSTPAFAPQNCAKKAPRLFDADAANAVLSMLVQLGELQRAGERYALPGFQVRLTRRQSTIRETLLALCEKKQRKGCQVRGLAAGIFPAGSSGLPPSAGKPPHRWRVDPAGPGTSLLCRGDAALPPNGGGVVYCSRDFDAGPISGTC